MKNYWIALGLFLFCLFAINCNRRAQHFTRQEVELLVSELEEVPTLADTFYLGDTIQFVYQTDQLLLFDTLLSSVTPEGALRLLDYKELAPDPEMMFVRMDISEAERQKRHAFSYLAKKKGMAKITISAARKNVSTNALELGTADSWQIYLEKR